MQFPDRLRHCISARSVPLVRSVSNVSWRRTALLACVAGSLSFAGCFGKAEGPTGTVTGKVTFEGKPVAEGRVAFVSAAGHGASGSIEADGQFKLRRVEGDQILVGTYQAVVQPPPTERAPQPDVPVDTGQKSSRKIMAGAPGDPVVKEYPDIPLRYRNPATSGWSFTVNEGENRFELEMKR